MKDLKKLVAQEALRYIKPNQTIGVGAGTTMSHLIDFIKTLPFIDTLHFITPSYSTKMRLKQAGLKLLDVSQMEKIDLYVDSCDLYDSDLNALKSGGGVHTMEKLMASMAKDFILLVDASKFNAQITQSNIPLCIEVLPAAECFVKQWFKNHYPASDIVVRMGQRKDGAVITEQGNMLLDVFFHRVVPLHELNIRIKTIPGVVEHSLFYRIASHALIATEEHINEIQSETR